jgi:hypothetical protein
MLHSIYCLSGYQQGCGYIRKYCRAIAACLLVFGVLLAVGVFLTVTEATDEKYSEVPSDNLSVGTAGPLITHES